MIVPVLAHRRRIYSQRPATGYAMSTLPANVIFWTTDVNGP